MKKLLSLLAFAGMLFVISCSEDEPVALPPTVTAPAAASLQTGTSTTASFSFNADGGFASSSVSATGGTASVTTDGTAGATSGTIEVSFTAGDAGAGSVTLVVTDGNGNTANATAVFTISASAVPAISGIPATADVEAGATSETVTATITMADVSGTLTITKDGEAFGDPIDITTDGQTVDFSAATTIADANTSITFVFTATDADGDVATATHVLTVSAPSFETVVINENITGTVDWTADKIYELAARIIVEPSATLNIAAGTVIKGQPGDGANATALIVARGGTINATGTAEAPIIMTSTSDDIIPGQVVSPNLEATNSGLWGGFIVLGNGIVSEETGTGEDNIEGVPPNEGFAIYGGNNNEDNSGTITYVSVRHGGTRLGDGDEINGITLGGVGSGTTINNIEVIGNFDDGIEWFGGAVDVTNAVVWAADDDAVDIDQAYAGTISNVAVVAFSGTDHCFEIDGPEGTIPGSFTINGGTAKGADDELANFRAGATGSMSGVYFFNFVSPTFDTNGDEEGGTGEGDFDADDETEPNVGTTLTFANLEYTQRSGTEGEGATIDGVFKDGTDTAATFVDAPSANAGVDKSAFAGWSMTSSAGALDDF